jgi:hypothetical protein
MFENPTMISCICIMIYVGVLSNMYSAHNADVSPYVSAVNYIFAIITGIILHMWYIERGGEVRCANPNRSSSFSA